MKSCPKCNRTFPDEGQKFCTFDGGLLIAPQTFDPNATIRATSIDLNTSADRPTSRDLPDPNATIMENYPATVALPRNTGPTGTPTTGAPNTADFSKPAPPLPPTEVIAPPPSTVTSPAPSAPLPPAAARKRSKAPWIIAGLLVFLLLGGGALAGVFFFVVKPRLDEMAAQRNSNESRNVKNVNAATPEPSVEQPTPTPEESFVPPPGTVEFVNSNSNLDGALAERYIDFSFYYPETWKLSPSAGVRGATNFVEVERRLPPNFTQEYFAVGWYTSTGTFIGDLPSYPKRVEEFSSTVAKRVTDYRKVSEGPTKVNSMQGYEFRWEGVSAETDRGVLQLWGRVIFLPTGTDGDASGATLSMLSTSLAPELVSVEDVGEKGEAPVILESFRFSKKQ